MRCGSAVPAFIIDHALCLQRVRLAARDASLSHTKGRNAVKQSLTTFGDFLRTFEAEMK
jgi:hypothetical protein